MIKTVLFDLDGTLLNTIDDLADAGNWVCAQHGWPTFTVEQFKHMVGNGIPKLVERFSPENARTPEQLAATLAEFTARYDAHKEDKTAPYPGIPELLDALRAKGIQCAVFSNKADPLCGKIIAHYFGTGRFDAVRGSRPGVPTKPDPAGLYALMDEIGADRTPYWTSWPAMPGSGWRRPRALSLWKSCVGRRFLSSKEILGLRKP